MDFWQSTLDKAYNIRKTLHRAPEIAWQETKTAEFIRSELYDLDIPWVPCANTGTIAHLNQAKPGVKHIALRADIDALAIQEKTQLSHRSRYPGIMHACGHDGHTAALLATAAMLKRHEKYLPVKVTLIFQPAEEGGHGAKKMIEGGALQGIDEIYGWHNWPAFTFPQLYCPDSLVMCGNGTFKIIVKGKGGHSSQPNLCKDPVLAASAINLALQSIVTQKLPAHSQAVLAVTSINAPSGYTVIPDVAEVSGSIRVPDDHTRDLMNHHIHLVCENTARVYGVDCDVEVHRRYFPTINHVGPAGVVRSKWSGLFGHQNVISPSAPPVMASEDFSYYLREIPGAYALIGADDGERFYPPCHSAYYDFNDQLIPKVVQLFCALVGLSVNKQQPIMETV